MDRNTAAALGQNLSNTFSDIGQIFDPRVRAAADQQRLASESLRLKNANLGIENQFLPKQLNANLGLTGAQTNSANASAQYALSGAELRKEETKGAALTRSAKEKLLNTVNIGYGNSGPLTPSLPEGGVDYESGMVLPPLNPDEPVPAQRPIQTQALTPQQELERRIVFATASGLDPYQMAQAFASSKAQNSTAPTEIDQGLAGQGKQPWLATTAMDNENKRAIAAGDAQVKLLSDLFGGSASGSGNGLGLPKTAPNSFSDLNKVSEEAQAASFKTFGVPLDEEGAPEQDPYAPSRRVWSQSYANARRSGMMPLEAEAAANVHHFGTDQPSINSEDTFRVGFGKDPFIPAITNTEPLPVSPAFGADPTQSAAIVETIPSLFGLTSAQQPGATSTPPPVTGVEQPAQPREQVPPPMLQRPVEQPAPPARASDEFKRREGSAEKKARLGKEKEIASLEADIKDTLNTLKTGSVDTSGVGMMMGGMGGAFVPQPKSVKLSDDGYNRTLDRLKELETKLEKLKGGSDQSGQTPAVDLESRLSKYK